MEKPLATTLVEGQKIQNTWQKVGTVGMIGFNFRFNPLYKAAGQAIRSGEDRRLVFHSNAILSHRGTISQNPKPSSRSDLPPCIPDSLLLEVRRLLFSILLPVSKGVNMTRIFWGNRKTSHLREFSNVLIRKI